MSISNTQHPFLNSPLIGYAHHKIVFDENGKACDYQFLEINQTFEKLTGLQKENVINKTLKQAVPDIEKSDFDWIGFYAKVAMGGGEQIFEQYSELLEKWFNVHVYSTEYGYFTTIFTDVSEKMILFDILKKFNQYNYNTVDYSFIVEKARELSGAKFVVLNKFESDGKRFRTVGISGLNEIVDKVFSLLGFDLRNKLWDYDPNRESKIQNQKTTFFDSILELTSNAIPNSVINRIINIFGINSAVIVKTSDNEIMEGDFTFIFEKGKTLRKQKLVESYADMVGLLLSRINAEKENINNKNELFNLLEINLDFICVVDFDRKFKKINKAWSDALGYSIGKLLNSDYMNYVHPHDIENTEKAFDDLKQNGKISDFTNRYICNDGSYKWIEWQACIQGNMFFAAARDVTDKIKFQNELIESKKQLENSKLHFELLANNSFDIINILDENGIILSESYATKRILGYDAGERVGKNTFQYIHPEDIDYVSKEFAELIKIPCSSKIIEFRFQHTDGSWKWLQTSGQNFLDNELIRGIIINSRDITDKKIAEHKLIESEARLREITENMGEVFWLRDIETGKILYVNDAYEKIWGRTKDSLFENQNSFIDAVLEQDKELVLDMFNKQNIQSNLSFDCRILKPDGKIRWVHIRTFPVKNSSGKISRQTGIAVDLSDKKHIEEKLRKLTRAVEQSSATVVITDLEGNIEYVNPAFSKITGYSYDEAIGKNPRILKSDKLPKKEYSKLWKTISQGNDWRGEFCNKKKDGNHYWESAVISPIRDNDNNITHYLAIKEDITQRKEIEQALIESEARFKALFNESPISITIHDAETAEIIDANKAAYKNYGLSSLEEYKQNYFWAESPYSFSEAINWIHKTANDGEQHFEWKNYKKNGEVFWEFAYLVPIYLLGKKRVMATTIDITERKNTEHIINARLDLVEYASHHSINEILEKAISDIKIITNSTSGFFLFIDPNKEDISLKIVVGECGNNMECLKDSEEVKKSINCVTAIINNEKKCKYYTKNNGVTRELFVPIVRNNKTVAIAGLFNKPQDYTEKDLEMLKYYSDISWEIAQHKIAQIELVQSKEEAEAANKAKSEFLANMSHEIRTPLNGVIGFTELLKNTSLNPVQAQYVKNANISGQTLMGIINDILDFSKIEAGMLELEIIKTDIIELIENTIDLIKYTAAQKGIEVLLNVASNTPRFAEVDPIRLKQILSNLLSNAVKFTEKGEVELKIDYNPKSDTEGVFSFCIRDTGIGISTEQIQKLFNPFTQADNSTTRKFGGTGLGLVISQMIAQKMGSKINIKSEINTGTTFYFDITTNTEYGNKHDISYISNIKRCLIIDDNENNRLILEKILKNWNIQTKSADCGMSGIKILEKEEFDLVICDYHIPYLDGLETIKIIRNKLLLDDKKLPIILLHSSIDDTDLHKKCDELNIIFRLSKPVKSDDLFNFLCNIENKAVKSNLNNSEDIKNENTYDFQSSILIAEDVPLNMVMITDIILQQFPNINIIEAKNGKEAIELWQIHKPAIILMDVQMPEMDGIEATREIRELESNSNMHTSIIALTAGALKEEKEKCMNAGMDDFLTKPIEPFKLIQTLLYKLNKEQTDLLHFNRKEFENRFGNSSQMYNKLYDSVVFSFTDLLDALLKAINIDDYDLIKSKSHAIKGAAANMCFDSMNNIAFEMETAAKEKSDISHIKHLYSQLSEEWNRAIRLMKTENDG